jgi:hypothetical protein
MRSSILLSFGRGTLFSYSVVASYYFVGYDARDILRLNKAEAQTPRVQNNSSAIRCLPNAAFAEDDSRLVA